MTIDEVSQLDRDISTALTTVRELKNSLALINRIPLDILSLIPTHLNSQNDIFRASFVCRNWRRAFLQHGALWSTLFVGKGGDYVTTLLERAKGSALHIIVDYQVPLETITLLSPHAQKIRHLEFPSGCWGDVLMFARVNSQPLPLLRTLEIYTTRDNKHHSQSDMLATPSLPLFGGCVNLVELGLDLDEEQIKMLDHFSFPNLTTFVLSVFPTRSLDASHLLDFLKASPTLRTVDVRVYGCIKPGGIPRDTVVALPNVETFCLYNLDDACNVYESAIHISCPRAKYTSLTQEIPNYRRTRDLGIFPDTTSWERIVRQYTRSPIKEVTLEIDGGPPNNITCSLIFQSSDNTVIKLRFEALHDDAEGLELSYEEMNLKVFSQACRTIQGLPLLSHVKRFRFKDGTGTLSAGNVPPMAYLIGGLFKSLGPLDELIIHGCDLQIFLPPFIGPCEFWPSEQVFPHVQWLTISEALIEQQCMDAIVNLAKLQHELEKPFECVTICARGIPPAMAERLGQWVNAVDCHEPSSMVCGSMPLIV